MAFDQFSTALSLQPDLQHQKYEENVTVMMEMYFSEMCAEGYSSILGTGLESWKCALSSAMKS